MNDTQAEIRKARRLAREQAKGRTTEETEVRDKTIQRNAAVASQTGKSTTVPLMLGDIQVGKATVNVDGSIIARINPSSLGEALYPAIKDGSIAALQLGASLIPEIKG